MLALPAVCMALGFWVAAVRIADRSAWLLLALLLSLPAAYIGGTLEGVFGRDNVFQPVLAGFAAFFNHIAAPTLMLFGIAFPERLPFDRRFPWLKWIVAGYLVLVASLAGIAVGLWVHHVAVARQLIGPALQFLTGVEGDFGGAVSFLALVICAGSLGWKAMTAPSRDARRRLLLLFVGAGPGVAALLIVLIAGRLEYSLPPWSYLPLDFDDPGVSPDDGLRHRRPSGDGRARRRAAGAAVRAGPRRDSRDPDRASGGRQCRCDVTAGGWRRSRARREASSSAWWSIVAIGGKFADRLRRWVDRRFFREAYEADAILSDLADEGPDDRRDGTAARDGRHADQRIAARAAHRDSAARGRGVSTGLRARLCTGAFCGDSS